MERYVRVYVCVKHARMNARVSADREASGKEMIAVAMLHSAFVDLSACKLAFTFAPRAGPQPRSYESLVVNRSNVMRESINRNPFSSFLEASLSSFLSLLLAPLAVSLRERRFSFISRFIHLPEKQPRMRCAVACRGIVRYLSKAVLIPRGSSIVAARVKF